ncbi:MAG: PGF-CTERM sorting domain-containing protein, partial [Methanoculleus sp.]
GPPDAAEAFAGTWEDLLTGESGTVGAGEPRNPGPGAATAPGTPGFGCAAAIVALAAAYRWRCGR